MIVSSDRHGTYWRTPLARATCSTANRAATPSPSPPAAGAEQRTLSAWFTASLVVPTTAKNHLDTICASCKRDAQFVRGGRGPDAAFLAHKLMHAQRGVLFVRVEQPERPREMLTLRRRKLPCAVRFHKVTGQHEAGVLRHGAFGQ